MSEIDWGKAPKDATHWFPGNTEEEKNAGWVSIIGDVYRFWGPYNGGWHEDPVDGPIDFPMCVKRPLPTAPTPRIAAHEFLERGVKHMRDRAVQRDSDAGERSMARAVAAFNAQEGTNLTEAQGWRFMIQLKYARAVNGVFVADDYEDMAAYAGLAGEAAQ